VIPQSQRGGVPAVVHHAAGCSGPGAAGRVEPVPPLCLDVGPVSAAADHQQLPVGQEGVAAAEYGVAVGGVWGQVRLVDRVLERRRGRVVGVPQQGGLVRGDEQHLAGVHQGRVHHAVVAARPRRGMFCGKTDQLP
jgi:hypothetical protein